MRIQQMTYTSCPRGKGVDDRDGFQVRAISPGMTDETREQLLVHCKSYKVPQSARRALADPTWDELPPEVAAQLPVVVSYYPIGDDLFALTRVCYVGRDHSGRAGNLFSHNLVFQPEALVPVGANAVALARSDLLKSRDDDSGSELPELEDFRGVQAPTSRGWRGALTRSPYQEHFPAMVSAAVRAPEEGRPVIIVLDELDMALPLIEAMLMSLPPEARCRLSFCSYEPDPLAVLPRRDASADAPSPFQVLVTSSRAEGGGFEGLQDHYDSQFAVFNFSEQRFSDLPEGTARWAESAARALVRSGGAGLKGLHDELADFRVARRPEVWDTMLQWASLAPAPEAVKAPKQLRAGVAALASVATAPAQARLAAERVWPYLQAAAGIGGDCFVAVARDHAKLVDAMGDRLAREWCGQEQVVDLAADVLRAGRGVAAQALMPESGEVSGELASRALGKLVAEGWPTADVAGATDTDKVGLAQVLPMAIDGMRAREDEGTSTLATEVLARAVAAVCDAGAQLGIMERMWPRLRPALFDDLLQREPAADALKAAELIRSTLTAGACPQAEVELDMWRLRVQEPSTPGEQRRALADLARKADRTDDEETMKSCLDLAREITRPGDRERVRCEMVEAIGPRASARHPYYRALAQGGLGGDGDAWSRAESAANEGHGTCLGIALVEVLPQHVESEAIVDWVRSHLPRCPGYREALDGLAVFVADRARRGRRRMGDELFPLVLDLLDVIAPMLLDQEREGREQVFGQVARGLVAVPLYRLRRRWRELLQEADGSGWPQADRDRLLIARTLTGDMRPALGRGRARQNWLDATSRLDPGYCGAVADWLTEHAMASQVQSRWLGEAREVCRLYGRMGDEAGAERLAATLTLQVQGTDVVRQVLVIAPFAFLGAMSRDHEGFLVRALGQPLGELNRQARAMLVEFLAGAARVPEDWRERLQHFWHEVQAYAPRPRGGGLFGFR